MTGRRVMHALIYLSFWPVCFWLLWGTAAAMFTHLTGSTATNERLGDDARADFRHRR